MLMASSPAAAAISGCLPERMVFSRISCTREAVREELVCFLSRCSAKASWKARNSGLAMAMGMDRVSDGRIRAFCSCEKSTGAAKMRLCSLTLSGRAWVKRTSVMPGPDSARRLMTQAVMEQTASAWWRLIEIRGSASSHRQDTSRPSLCRTGRIMSAMRP